MAKRLILVGASGASVGIGLGVAEKSQRPTKEKMRMVGEIFESRDKRLKLVIRRPTVASNRIVLIAINAMNLEDGVMSPSKVWFQALFFQEKEASMKIRATTRTMLPARRLCPVVNPGTAHRMLKMAN